MSQFFGRFALSVGATTLVQGLPPTGIAAIVISNESSFSVVATLEGVGQSLNIPAGIADMLPVPSSGFNGNVRLAASAQLTIQNSPSSQVEINIYGYGEQVPSVYPLSLNRINNTGNDVGVQGQLLLTTVTNINNSNADVGQTGKTVFLQSIDLTGSFAGGQAKGAFTITGFSTEVDPGQTGLTYEIEVDTGRAMQPIIREWKTPLAGVLGGSVNFTCPSMSTAVIALNIYYYLV